MKINRTQEGPDDYPYKQIHHKVDHGDPFDRWVMETYCHPNYEKKIHIKIPSMSFSLSLDEARNLSELLTKTLNEFKE